MNHTLKLTFAFVVTCFLYMQSATAATATAISAGGQYACAITDTATVQCWGRNNYGQLGDGSTNTRTSAGLVQGLSNVTAIAAGNQHICALISGGTVKCWGWNSFGQLGDGTTTDQYTPVSVVGLSGITAIAASGQRSCALTSGGGVKCWGYNAYGQLGDGTTTNSLTPVDVVGLGSGVASISAGVENHTCALTTGGAVLCWGLNNFGQLGDNSTTDRYTPVAVSGLGSGVDAIDAGSTQTCALTNAGAMMCWGNNTYGQLGNNTQTHSSVPVTVSTLSSGVTAVASGFGHSCALLTGGAMKCWGNNAQGQVGDNSTTERHTPVNVNTLGSGVAAIATGGSYSCAMLTGGDVKCWGGNGYGQIADGTTVNKSTPTSVVDLNVDIDGDGMPLVWEQTYGLNPLVDDSAGDPDADGFTNVQEYWNNTDPTVFNGPVAKAKNDFDHNGRSDVLFINSTTSATQYWKGAVKAESVFPGTYDPLYTYKNTGDFDGNGTSDLFFTRADINGTMIWSDANKSAQSYPGSSTAGFNVAAVCDVNGDASDDVIWHNPTTGGTQIWYSAVKASAAYPGAQNTAYTVVACDDFDGDGSSDIFWRNLTTGGNEIWLGGSKTSKSYPGAFTDLTWSVFGTGDTNGNLNSDLVWYRPSTGATQIWEGGLKSAASYPGKNSLSFTPKAIGDYNGDGSADLFWSNDSTLGTQIWSGVVKAAVTYPGSHGAGFVVQK